MVALLLATERTGKMTRSRHARPPILMPETGGRWLLVSLGVVACAVTLFQEAPHYELVGNLAIACAVVLAGACPGPVRARLRRVVVGASGF
jgi:hypothetical protein